MGVPPIGDDEIIALTLRNRRAATLLSPLVEEKTLGGYVSDVLMDHDSKLDAIWAVLQPESPSALPFTFEQWKRAMASVCCAGLFLDDLDSGLQMMEFSRQNNDPSVKSARSDWEHMRTINGPSLEQFGQVESYVHGCYNGWPQPVKDRIGSVSDKLSAMKRSIEFETKLRSAAGLDASIPR